DGDFDLDSFLLEGPKPKALPPIKEEAAKKGGPPPRGGSGRKLSMSDDETNVSGPSETLPPPNRRASAAESAMAALTGGGTSSSAKDLLAKATQEGRARAASMPEDVKERFDYAGAIKTIGKEYGLHVLGTFALCGVLYFGMNYMLGSNTETPPLARVYGRVTVKKQPIEGVIVTFTPIGAKDGKDTGTKLKKGAPRAATGVTDKDGNYELMYMEGIRGAVIGQNRVWIDPFTFENTKKLPPNYQSAATSGDVREVKATGGEENIDL
ncbi:MAG TPA: hypothetical protein VM452_18410, partial [Caulifigura sp.]|nr:hypothetical protein [Caulifigura sp.]